MLPNILINSIKEIEFLYIDIIYKRTVYRTKRRICCRKKRDALEYLDLCVEPETRLLASSSSRMHSRSACECYCKTRVPIAKQREEIRREKGNRGAAKDGGSKSSLGKTETARSAGKASLISTNVAQRQQLDSKRSAATNSILSPETSAAIEDVEKLMKDAEIQMREIRRASEYSRIKSRPNLYSNEAPLDDEADQLLYIRERVAHKFEEANGCFSTPDPSFQQRSCTDKSSIAIKSKKMIDFSAARFRSRDDPYEEFSQQRRRDLEKLGLSCAETKKADGETRKGKAEVARIGKLETCSVQAGPSVNIKGELRKQNLDNVHISPDSSFAHETQNVATYVVLRDFEKNASPRPRREKFVKIPEDDSSNGKQIKRRIVKNRGSGLQTSEEASKEELGKNSVGESSKEKLVEIVGRVGEEEKVLEEEVEKGLEENNEGSAKDIDAQVNEETKVDTNLKGEEKQVRFESLATQTDAILSKSLSEAAKLQSCSSEPGSLSKETKAKVAKDKNGYNETGERCKTEPGREDRYEKIGESLVNVVAKYQKNGDNCESSLNVANTSKNSRSLEASKNSKTTKRSTDLRNSKDCEDSKDSKSSKDWTDLEDSQSSTDDLFNFYEPNLAELDTVLVTYDRMIDDVSRSTRRVDEFLSRPEMEEYRQRSVPSTAKPRRDARIIEAPKVNCLINPPIKPARDANYLPGTDKAPRGYVKPKTSPVKKGNDSKTQRDAARNMLGFASNPRRSLKTKEERRKREESASDFSENRTRDEKLMRVTGTEETRSLENLNWKHDSSSCIASTKSEISSGKEDWELSEKKGNLHGCNEEIEEEDPIGRILREEFVEDAMKKLFNAEEMVAVVVKSVLENLKSDAAPDTFQLFVRQRANFPSTDTIEKEKSQDGETVSATETRKCDEDKSSRVSEESDLKKESITESKSSSKGKESVDLRNSPIESSQAKDNGNSQGEEVANESIANTVSKIEDKVEDVEKPVGEILRANDETEDDKLEDDKNETASNGRSESIAEVTRANETLSKVSIENSSNIESKGEDKEIDDHLSSDSLRDCASLGSCSRNVSKEELNKQTLETAKGESLTSNAAFERERILADVYDEVNRNLLTNRPASDRGNQDRFSSGVSTAERNKVEVTSESSHSEGELYGASSGSYSLGEIRMLSKSRSDGETTDLDDNIGAFVTKRMLASWNESSKSLVQSMGEI